MNKMAEETKEMFAENDEAAVYVSSSQPTNKRLTMTSIDYLNARQQVGRSTFVTRAGRMKLQPSNMAYSLAWYVLCQVILMGVLCSFSGFGLKKAA
jgi:hypothetical protein